jgi:hypothetical protein
MNFVLVNPQYYNAPPKSIAINTSAAAALVDGRVVVDQLEGIDFHFFKL